MFNIHWNPILRIANTFTDIYVGNWILFKYLELMILLLFCDDWN